MKNIVIDTNVLLSAFKSNKGASFLLLSLIDSGLFRLNISTTLIKEYEYVLKQKIQIGESFIDDILDYICLIGYEHDIFYLRRPFLKDPNNDFILELAVRSNSSIITYNKKDFSGVDKFGVKVLNPKEFLKLIGKLGQ